MLTGLWGLFAVCAGVAGAGLAGARHLHRRRQRARARAQRARRRAEREAAWQRTQEVATARRG